MTADNKYRKTMKGILKIREVEKFMYKYGNFNNKIYLYYAQRKTEVHVEHSQLWRKSCERLSYLHFKYEPHE